jgi:phosphoglycerol transferase MdoB-like AlkP superfamily enzyme
MVRRLKFILLQLLAWIAFFELARIIFLLYHHKQTSQLSFKTILLTFVYGFRMDLSMACYLIVLPFLFVLLSVFVPFFRKRLLYKIYSGFVLFFFLLIILSDLEIYQEWGYRLDSTVLQYLSSPKEVAASTGHLPVFWILLVFVLVFGGLVLLFNRTIDKSIFLLQPKKERKLISGVVIACFIALLIIPIRGGVQMQPMNPSWVYFSSSNFANITALNAPWNFFQDVMDKERGIKNPYQYLSIQRSKQIVDSLYYSSNAHVQVVDTSIGKPNVILIFWESFTKKVVDTLIDGKEVSPNFNRFKKEGIYFSNIYASGDRTHKGMSSIFSGYPALPNTSIIRFPQKSAKLTLISNLFKQHGYINTFFYGGDPNYDNYKSYLLHGEFDRITDKDLFDSKDKPTEWGALDGAVAKYIENDFPNWKQPFFNCWLTLSSHVPYKVPGPAIFKGGDETSKFLNSIHYTDEVIGNFIKVSQKQAWWKNTIIIIIADHGIRFPSTGKIINDFEIPMLWLGGAVEKNKGLVINKLASQVDLSTTLIKQFGWNNSAFPFSRDITDSTSLPFSFFSNSVSFALVQPAHYFIYDVKGAKIMEQRGNVTEKDLNAGKALQQFIYDDYLKK